VATKLNELFQVTLPNALRNDKAMVIHLPDAGVARRAVVRVSLAHSIALVALLLEILKFTGMGLYYSRVCVCRSVKTEENKGSVAQVHD
jgi:hypothetical protein